LQIGARMKVINVSSEPIYLDDINVMVPYSSNKRVVEIPDSSARTSRALAVMLHTGRVIDVTKGTPVFIPEFKPKTVQPDPESPWFAKQAVLSRDEHGEKRADAISTVSPLATKKITYEKLPSALTLFENGTTSLSWTGPACFPPDAKVLTSVGTKPISEIKEGDLVFTHMGRLRKVLTVYRRPYRGEMVSINTALDAEEIILTPYHRVVCARGSELYPRQNHALEKIPAGDLTTNDFLVKPKIKDPKGVSRIDIKEYNSRLPNARTFTRITNLSRTAYDGDVYDLQVEGDHTYLVNGKAFSNSDAGGFSRMNKKFMFGLSDAGCLVRYDKLDSINDMDKETNSKLAKLIATRVPDDAIKVYGMTSPMIYDWSRYKLLFTMMETRRLHPDYVIRTNCADEVVVPSKWCYDVFKESGVTRPMSVVPLGVDTDIYYPGAEPIAFTKNLKPFIFLSVFGWSLRKGYDVLLKAYLEEFTSDEPVTLLISARYFGSTDESKKKVIRDDVARISSTISNPKKPQVVLFGDVLSDQMMPRLYASANCFVLITRGEGFGLPACEAAACKLPVITSRYSGHTDFCEDGNSYLVDVDRFAKADPSLAKISYFYENSEFPFFGPEAVAQTRCYMRRVFEHPDEARVKAERLYQRIVSEYNWPRCVGLMAEKLSQTYQDLVKTKGIKDAKTNPAR